MNKTILLCLALTCLLSLVGCEQKIDTWSGQNVAYINMEVDSTVVSFAYLDEDVDTVSVEIAVMGDVEEGVSRYVEVKLVEKNAMVGEDYETLAERYEVPSGTTSCVVPVVVKRPNDESDNKQVTEELPTEPALLRLGIFRHHISQESLRQDSNCIQLIRIC